MSTPETQTRTQFTRESIIDDYRIAVRSRQASLLGRREVLTGKAKFGIFGDGKEVAQLARARAFRKGDLRSGYYRDQTFMFALGAATLGEFFAQLYAARRRRARALVRRPLDERALRDAAARIPTAPGSRRPSTTTSPPTCRRPARRCRAWSAWPGPRGSTASSAFRTPRSSPATATRSPWARSATPACAEGMFWESINAAGVLGIPMVVSIWDDGYGISVPNEFQITKGDLSELLKGFQRDPRSNQGFDIYTVKAWDYPALCETYIAAVADRAEGARARDHPRHRDDAAAGALHVGAATSATSRRSGCSGRSSSTASRKMREWMIAQGIATAQELDEIEKDETRNVREAQRRAWEAYREPIDAEMKEAMAFLDARRGREELKKIQAPFRRDVVRAVAGLVIAMSRRMTARIGCATSSSDGDARYGAHLYSESSEAALEVAEVRAKYADDAPVLNGFEIINHCFDHALRRDARIVIFGEDVGKLGDVNQGCVGLQEKYGALRVTDTGIRESTIVGQAIGMAMRGLRPIAEIQYLDYLLYALQIMSDDLATLRWRTSGRAEGAGHRPHARPPAGRDLALRLADGRHHQPRARHVRLRAAQHDPGRRLLQHAAALGRPGCRRRGAERLPHEGKASREHRRDDGAARRARGASGRARRDAGHLRRALRIAMEAAELLAQVGIDVGSHRRADAAAVRSARRDRRVAEEDQPRRSSSTRTCPAAPRPTCSSRCSSARAATTGSIRSRAPLPAKEHRPSYGSDGDYWSKPNRESIFAAVYELMREVNPRRFPPKL